MASRRSQLVAGNIGAGQMATHFPVRGGTTELKGRRRELRVLDRLVDAVRAGESRALVVAGEPGVGKTALLDYLAGRASGFRVVRTAGVQSEMELAFAALHQLCAPMLDRLERLPVPQRDALRTAFGLSAGPAPDRFLVGLAVLGLLSEAAGERPLVCLVDDEQWLDRASAQVLGFVARRLAAEPVGLVFVARVRSRELAGLPELVVEGLREGDAAALLDSALTGPLDERVRDQIVTETRGNPLALLELVRGLTPAELAGGFGLPGAAPLAGGSRRASGGGWTLFLPRPGGCCSSRRPTRPAIRAWCGGQRGGSGSRFRRRHRRPRQGCWSLAPGCGSGIRWCARLPTGRRLSSSGRMCTARWRRSPTRRPIRTAAPGTGRRPRRGRTSRSLRSWSTRPAGRRRAGAGRGGRVPRARGDADA